MNRQVISICLFAILPPLLGGCLLDLYGGSPRVQVDNGASGWRVDVIGIGDSARPTWSRGFDPPVPSGSVSPVEECPVAGDLELYILLRDSLGKRAILRSDVALDVGGFRKLRVDLDSAKRLRMR